MSLRTRIVLLFVGLLGVLAAAELWLAQALTRDLSLEVGRVAEQVGQSVVRVIGDSDRSSEGTPAAADVVVSRDPDSGDLVILTSGDEARGDGTESITLDQSEPASPPAARAARKRWADLLPLFMAAVNHHVDSGERATVLSSCGMSRQLAIVVVMPVMGQVAERFGCA